MFKTIRVYIKLRRDVVEITNLETGRTVSHRAAIPFSTTRNLVGDFNSADLTIREALRELGVKLRFWIRLKVLIQQLEGAEGGLSEIEKRALRDLGELAGGLRVYLVEDTRPLSISEALLYFN